MQLSEQEGLTGVTIFQPPQNHRCQPSVLGPEIAPKVVSVPCLGKNSFPFAGKQQAKCAVLTKNSVSTFML